MEINYKYLALSCAIVIGSVLGIIAWLFAFAACPVTVSFLTVAGAIVVFIGITYANLTAK